MYQRDDDIMDVKLRQAKIIKGCVPVSNVQYPKRRLESMTARSVNSMNEINLKPVGFAKNNVKELRFGNFGDEITEIVMDEEFTDALTGIDDYSHVIIVFWMDKVKGHVITHRPQGNPDVSVVGIFSCRCPPRPNPIAVTTVRLVGHEGNKIKVKGLDILNGTPIIDIKPYWPQYDKVDEGKIPDWVYKLEL